MSEHSQRTSTNRTVSTVARVGTVAGLVVATAGVAFAAVSLPGCDAESCNQIRNDYQQAVDAESGLVDLEEGGPPHAAVAVDVQTVDDWTSSALEAAVGDGLSTGGSVEVQGQSVNFSVGSTDVDLRLAASDACDACLSIGGDFDGDAEVDLPVLGSQSTPLSGSLDWTMPLKVGRDEGDAAIFFDTDQAVEMGMPSLQGRLDGLPGDWSEPVASAMMAQLGQSVADRIDPIRLVGYEMPSFGVDGLELAPTTLALDGQTDTLVLGVRTNFNIPASGVGEGDVVEALTLGDDQNLAVAADPRLAAEGVRMALRGDEVPRRYDLSGNADPDGNAYAVVDDLTARSHGEVADALQVGLDFRLFNFRSTLACFSMTGETLGRLAIDDGVVDVEIEDVEFSAPSGLMSSDNWGAAPFVDHSTRLLNQSLDGGVVSVPDVEADILPTGLSTEAGMVVVRGSGS